MNWKNFFLIVLFSFFIFGCVGSSLPLGLCSSCGESGLLFSCSVRTSLVAEFRLWSTQASVVTVPGL